MSKLHFGSLEVLLRNAGYLRNIVKLSSSCNYFAISNRCDPSLYFYTQGNDAQLFVPHYSHYQLHCNRTIAQSQETADEVEG